MVAEHLFVYGTLRREAHSDWHRLLTTLAEFVDDGVFQGKLYRVDWYPGAVPSKNPQDQVRGEVYRLPDSALLLPRLDEYEGCDRLTPATAEFVRQKHAITLRSGAPVEAWIYVYARPTEGLSQILSGDFLRPRA